MKITQMIEKKKTIVMYEKWGQTLIVENDGDDNDYYYKLYKGGKLSAWNFVSFVDMEFVLGRYGFPTFD